MIRKVYLRKLDDIGDVLCFKSFVIG